MSSNNDTSLSSHTQLFVVIKSFEARLPDELTINEGDIIDLISDDSEFDDGWYMGKNKTTGKVGLYPKVFTQIKPESDFTGSKPSLLRSRSRRTPQGSPITSHPPSQYFSDSPNFNSNHTPDSTRSNINGQQTGVNRYVNDIDNALKELNLNRKDTSFSANSPDISNLDKSHNNLHPDINDPLNPINVENWTPEQVAEYFGDIIDQESANKFIIHKISGAILLELELAYLKELDINSFGTRFQIFKEIEDLKSFAKLSESQPYDQVNDSSPDVYKSSTFVKPEESAEYKPRLLKEEGISRKSSIGTNRNRFSYKQTPRPNSTIVDHHSRFTKSTPSPLQFNNQSNESAAEYQLDQPDYVQIDGLDKSPKFQNNDNIGEEQFTSPRKAPQPPSYPSPVSNNPARFGIRSPVKSTNANDTIPKLANTHSRNSSAGGASSIYVDTSPTSFNRRHSNLISENLNLVAEPNQKPKRYSSIIYNKTIPIDSPKELVKEDQLVETNLKQKKKPERRSVSAKEYTEIMKNKDVTTKRVTTDIANAAAVAALSSSSNSASPKPASAETFSNQPQLSNSKSSFRKRVVGNRANKSQTSAFQEGIRSITPNEALKDADYSGWMFKKGNLSIGSWKHRFFTLHGTRLSYFATSKDSKEKGLIDITSHKVLPATETEDKLSAVYAATAGYGRYCFKVVPPAPGSRTGLTFTQQKVHYFAVETKEEMRAWMSALMKATIELDESVPVISSCVTPTVSLQKAKENMIIARENAMNNLGELQEARRRQLYGAQSSNNSDDIIQSYEDPNSTTTNSNATNGDSSPDIQSFVDSNELNSKRQSIRAATPSSNDSANLRKPRRIPSSENKPSSSAMNGMSTPYLMTAGLMSSTSSNMNNLPSNDSPARMASVQVHVPTVTRLDDPEDNQTLEPPSHTLRTSNSFSGRLRSLRRVSKDKE